MPTFSVVGFGKIGQAIGAQILKAGHRLIGIDINPNLPRAFADGKFTATEPLVADSLLRSYKEERLRVSTDFSEVKNVESVIVSIPLLVDCSKRILEKPFLDCFEKLAPHLSCGCLLSVETSIPVGFSRNKIHSNNFTTFFI